ncbi:MAG TPA: amino acid ABC transporter permease [Nocardioides sp.]
MEVVWENRGEVATAFSYTLVLFVTSGILSLVMGTILAAMRVGPVAVMRWAASTYVTLVRNTPLLIIYMFFRIGGPKIDLKFTWVDWTIGNVDLDTYVASGIVALTVYTSTFVCEALRSGVNAVPIGQAEAARAIGMPFAGTMRHVIIPQAFRASVPPLASVQIALLKNTTVIGALGVVEAFTYMYELTNDNAAARIGIFLSFAAIFVVLVELLSFAANRLERRWSVAR